MDAFAPDCSSLSYADFSVVTNATADLSCHGVVDPDAVVASLVTWGLKVELTWDDVMHEAGASAPLTSSLHPISPPFTTLPPSSMRTV